jgi:lysophospholipid acyltransferase (LPLAT)-like uncharacterized protein
MRFRNPTLERLLVRGMVSSLRLLFRTVRTEFHIVQPETSPYVTPPGSERYTYCVWHDSLILPLFVGRQDHTTALVGMHRDGTFLTNSLNALGMPSVRGSSSRGGAQAVRQLLQETHDRHIVLTPDGPRGPRRTMKAGCAFVASRTGHPVVPTAFACRRSWHIGTGWTDLMIPRPFTAAYVVTGNAIPIPPDASRDELDEYTSLIQEEMDRLDSVARKLAAGVSHGDQLATQRSAGVRDAEPAAIAA